LSNVGSTHAAKRLTVLRSHTQVLIPLVIAAALLFPGLGDRCLWGDEAETALVATTLLSGWLPRVWDGRNIFSIWECSFNADLVETLSPWLQYYLTAGSFALLGKTALAARLPFAMVGLGTVLFTYCFLIRLSGDRLWALFSSLFLAVFVPFLLFTKQCRYYALTELFCILLLYAYLSLEKRSLAGTGVFVTVAALFFHSNYLLFACVMFALLVWTVFAEQSRNRKIGVAVSMLPIAGLTVPWLLYAGTLRRGIGVFTTTRMLQSFGLMLKYVQGVDWFGVFPLGIMLLTLFALVRRREGKLTVDRSILMVLVISAGFLISLCFVSPQEMRKGSVADMRYVVPLLPLSAVLVSGVCLRVYRWQRWVGVVLIVAVVFTDLPRYSGTSFGSKMSAHRPWANAQRYVMLDLVSYGVSLTRPYRGAYEDVVSYLQKNADPDDIVWCTPPATVEPLIFHTGLRFANRFQPENRPVEDDISRQIMFAREAKLPKYVYANNLLVDWIVDLDGVGLRFSASSVSSERSVPIYYDSHTIQTVHWNMARPELWMHAFLRQSAGSGTHRVVIHRKPYR